jgi:hypothetical protein
VHFECQSRTPKERLVKTSLSTVATLTNATCGQPCSPGGNMMVYRASVAVLQQHAKGASGNRRSYSHLGSGYERSAACSEREQTRAVARD